MNFNHPKLQLNEGWRVQWRTIYALMVRDLMMRYGRDNIGFVWVILEPMILTLGVMAVWSLWGGYKSGIKVVEFVLTGYMPLTLWRHMTAHVSLFRNGASLLYHRRVSLLDIIAARQALEFVGTTTALVVIYSTLLTIGLIDGAHRFDLLLLGWLMMSWIAAVSGACIAVITERYEVAERFVQPIQYLNIPISGAFFMIDWMPGWAQKLALLHPLAHCYEVFRGGYFGDALVVHYSIPYFCIWAFVMTFLALRGVDRVRNHVRLN